MKIFLTGGTGFIGFYVLRDALAAGYEVVALRRTVSSRSILPLPSEPHWLERDLLALEPKDLYGCSAVVHLASAGVSPQQVPWHELVQVNVMGAAHLIDIARQAGVKRFVVSGTCHEYGASATRMDDIHSDAPLEPLTLYGASKAASFHLLSAYARSQGMELYYARIFNVYGEGQYEKNFWPSLQAAARQGVDFPMTTGDQLCDFVPVEKVAESLLAACTQPLSGSGDPVVKNIRSGRPQSLLSFAQKEWKKSGAVGKLLPGAMPLRHSQ
ncbi:NAD(P)-dependent oxidoreductase [Synechococcus sp. J7-Johnson]|uniref:NAD-dependent epimerase/dehydratase family protein n=1 Tax=Synechococcus sp. J7-Johnson TaxID=2823737 RepID=UPI0020CC856F|nr:NAD(P)-dependent oxidoreductase [Synechococcus sp. J7-Johnson]MCP9841962.1 NAD(P)-dependent oxidoreductase [Synechococcus sp. J7-Johnson]